VFYLASQYSLSHYLINIVSPFRVTFFEILIFTHSSVTMVTNTLVIMTNSCHTVDGKENMPETQWQ